VRDSMSEQDSSLQTPTITNRDVRPDSEQVLGSPPQSLSLDDVPSFSFVTSEVQGQNSGTRYTPEASSTTPSSTAGSSSDISLWRSRLGSSNHDLSLQTCVETSTSFQSSLKACEVCQELFSSSKLLL
jgi:hypothetical protein